MPDNNELLQSKETYTNIRQTVISAQSKVATVVNSAMVQAYWKIGELIMKNAETFIMRNVSSQIGASDS